MPYTIALVLPTEPQAIAAYVLMAWFIFIVWYGNRRSGASGSTSSDAPERARDESDADSATEELAQTGDDASRPASVKGHRGKTTRAQRRRQGHINWIQ